MTDDPLLTTQQVADLLGVKPSYVRKLLGRYGVTEQRGYARADVEAFRRVYERRSGQGRRTDLQPSPHTEEPKP